MSNDDSRSSDADAIMETVVGKVGLAIMKYLSEVPGLGVGDAMDGMTMERTAAICGAVGSVAVDALATVVLGQTDLYEPEQEGS